MFKNNDLTVSTKIKLVFKTTASVLIIATMIFTMLFASSVSSYGATNEAKNPYKIEIGDRPVLYVNSKQEAEQVVKGLRDYYLTRGASILDVSFEPAVQVVRVPARDRNDVITSNVEDAVKYLSDGKLEFKSYRVEEGDTLESIAKDMGTSAKKLVVFNFEKYDADETIEEGTYIVVYNEVPYVEVTTVEEITSEKSIDYDIVYKKSSSMNKGEYKVQTKGVKGKKQLVQQVTKVNGEAVDSELISSQVVKKPTNKVVVKGTGSVKARAGRTFDFVEGTEITDYAKKFVGNPYVYGGTSLTNGADCSGFVYAVYKHFGIDLPRTGQASVGKAVSYKNVKPGDILIYPGHVAIYAGNGKAVHAVNEGLGIRVTRADYTGPITGVRRIVK